MLRVFFTDDGEVAADFVLSRLEHLTPTSRLSLAEAVSHPPDLVVYADGKELVHRRFHKSKKLFVTVEDLYPDFAMHDYVIAYRYLDHPRYLRRPNWAVGIPLERFIKCENHASLVMNSERDFCCFVQSNGNPRRTAKRLKFFKKLNHRRFVHSGGSVLNNIGYRVGDIHDFLRKFKFSICFENDSSPGYTTEKIANAMLNGCIPIYWGNPLVSRDFNEKSFINVSNFPSEESAINHIDAVHSNPDLWKSYLDEPFFKDNCIPPHFGPEQEVGFFKRIVFDPPPKRSLVSIQAKFSHLKHRLKPYVPFL
jgi:hypothetical protein